MKRILLVEDEKELSRALAQMLMKDGYDVDCVYDGADGLNFASTGMYDIVLLDVMMPKLNEKNKNEPESPFFVCFHCL